VKSFKDAISHAETSQRVATGFDLRISCGPVSLELSAETGYSTPTLTLDVKPSGSEVVGNLYFALKRWLRGVAAPKWQRWWSAAGNLRLMVWITFLLVLTMGWAIVQGDSDSTYFKQQARDLIKQGVTKDNQQKAIETLLALQSEYPAPVVKYKTSYRFWFFCAGSAIVCLILSFPPPLVLGLGSGEDRIGYWRMWTRIVFFIVPTFVFSNLLWPLLSEYLKRIVVQ
jgi:hypothetical protein